MQINPVLSNPDNWSYYVHDHQGNTRVVLDDNGDIKSWYDYYPYGKIQRASVAGSDARFKFTGKEFDSEDDFDMYYFGARYYDPEIAGWLVTDPADQYHSPYSYVGLNPLNYVDPTGTSAGPIGGGGFGGGIPPWGLQPPSSTGGGGFNIPFSIYGTANGFGVGIPLGGGSFITDMAPPFFGKDNGVDGDCPDDEDCSGNRITVAPIYIWGNPNAVPTKGSAHYGSTTEKLGKASIALSGGVRGVGFGRPNNVIANYTIGAYAVAGTITGALGSLTSDINAGRLIATHDGILRKNTGRFQAHRGFTNQYLKNSRALGGIGLAIGAGLYGLDLYNSQNGYESALATGRFVGSTVGGFIGGLAGSAGLTPGVGTFLGASAGAIGGSIAGEWIVNQLYGNF